MRKIKNIPRFLLVIVFSVTFSFSALAQNSSSMRFAHVNITDIYKVMPGVDTAQQKIEELKEELTIVGEEMQKELQIKYEEYAKLSASYSPAVAKAKEDELNKMYSKLQQFTLDAEEELTLKQQQLLLPFQEKILEAIKIVAEREMYAYVFDISTLSFYENGIDITAKVKKEIGIK